MKPKISARKSSVKLIGRPMKIAPTITTSITMPSASSPLISDLGLLAVLEFAPGAYLEPGLHGLRHALHHEEQRRQRHRGTERPHHRAPGRLLGDFADLVGVPGIVDADREQRDQRR